MFDIKSSIKRFARYKISNKRLQNSEAYVQSQRLFLHKEITFKNVEKDEINSELRKIITDLRTVINLIDWTHIANKFMESNIKVCKKVEQIQSYKISQLMGSKLKHNPEEVVHNFSSYNLSTAEKSLLCKVQKFALPPKDLKFENYLLPFELLFRNVYESSDKDESLLHLKSKIKDVGLSSYRVYNKKDYRYENPSPEECDAFVNLSNNKGLIIQKADKVNTVVLLGRSSYVTQMEELPSDKSKFVKVTFNPKHKVNKELRQLLDMESTSRLVSMIF